MMLTRVHYKIYVFEKSEKRKKNNKLDVVSLPDFHVEISPWQSQMLLGPMLEVCLKVLVLLDRTPESLFDSEY